MGEDENRLEQIEKRLRSIEFRLGHLESVLGSGTKHDSVSAPEIPATDISGIALDEPVDDEGRGLESTIGRIGFAWMGNLVLLLGIIFLTEYLSVQGQRIFSVILGYSSAAAVFFISDYIRKSNSQLSFMMRMNGQLLLFFVTLRLHFLSENPVIHGKFIPLLLLLLIVAFQFYLALRQKSQTMAIIGIIFMSVTAVMGDHTHIMLPILSVTAAFSVYLCRKYGWTTQVIITIFIVYITYAMWILGNPVMKHPLELVAEHNFGYFYLFVLGGAFSLLPIYRSAEEKRDEFLISSIILNGFFFTLLLALVTIRFFPAGYVALFALITLCCLAYSILLKKISDWNFGSAFYALYGFMAMSISIYGIYGFPRVFLLLSVQSLIVVSMALWFRNRLMVIMNSLLFLSILFVYMMTPGSINGVNFSFAFVALVSARVINWQKARLEIRTEIIRNLYLLIGFFMVLNALYHALPGQFVTLSWTIAALVYFVLSFVLKNVKYRYMALGTIISAAFYLFIVDLAKIEVIYRVLAFLSLAVISIGISVYYSNRLKK